jgi:hypothetical protein
VKKGSTFIGIVLPIARGRLRRRELRKNKTRNDRSVRSRARSPAPDDESENKALDENPILARLADDDLRLRFNSGERLPERTNNKFPVALVIQFTGIHPDKSKSPDTSSNNISGKSREGIPLMTIRRLGSQHLVSQTKRFHVISYCNRGSEDIGTNFEGIPAKDPTNGSGNLCYKPTDSGEYSNPNSNEPLSQVEECPIHVATLIDEAGFVDGEPWCPKGFISMIECDPLPLLSHQSLIQPNSSDYSTFSRMDSDQYWHKFSTLLCGFTHPEDLRELPYSLGYGHDHTNPGLIYRRRRWGHLEVDSACPKSRRPRWRAAWKFEV